MEIVFQEKKVVVRAGAYRVVIDAEKCGEDTIRRIYYALVNDPGMQRLYYALPECFAEALCMMVVEYCGESSCEKQVVKNRGV